MLGSFLRKNQRALKLNSLTLLDTLVIHYSAYMNPMLLQIAIGELPPLLSEADLHVAQLSLVLLTSVAQKQPQALIGVYDAILFEVMSLVKSPLLQGKILVFFVLCQGLNNFFFVEGTALACTLNLFQSLVLAKLPGLGYRQLLEMLKQPVVQNTTVALHKQVHSFLFC